MLHLSDEDIERISQCIVNKHTDMLRGLQGRDGIDGTDNVARDRITVLEEQVRIMQITIQENLTVLRLLTNQLQVSLHTLPRNVD